MSSRNQHRCAYYLTERLKGFPFTLNCASRVLSVSASALIVLLTATLSQAAPPEERNACEENLTCARETKTVVIGEFSQGPRLSDWSPVAQNPEATVVPVAEGRVPQSIRDPVTGMELVLVPGACYRTNGLSGEANQVCLDPYYIGAHEVTFDAYDSFARATDRPLPDDEDWGRGRRPAINVSVYDALNFSKWLSRKTGTHYRLPTEVEWEHAARAGSTGVFPWGDELGENRANCDGCGSQWDDEQTAPVGSFQPNAWGLYDVAGNVGEWTCSMRDPDPTHSFERCDSIYKTRRRAYRNGGWSDGPESLAISSRDWNVAMRRSDDVGFRLVRECVECRADFQRSTGERVADQREQSERVMR
jgi:formylglycine-generating enzyme required for sulfatase activity